MPFELHEFILRHGVDGAVGGSCAGNKFDGVIDGAGRWVGKRVVIWWEDVRVGTEELGEPGWFGGWRSVGAQSIEVEGENLVFVADGIFEGGEGQKEICVRGRRSGESMEVVVVVKGEGAGRPVDCGVEALEPRHAQDDIKAREWGNVELIAVTVGGDGERKSWIKSRAVLCRAVGEYHRVGRAFGGWLDVKSEMRGKEIAVGARVDQNSDWYRIDVAVEDEEGVVGVREEGGGGGKMELVGGGGSVVTEMWRRGWWFRGGHDAHGWWREEGQ